MSGARRQLRLFAKREISHEIADIKRRCACSGMPGLLPSVGRSSGGKLWRAVSFKQGVGRTVGGPFPSIHVESVKQRFA
jgi:hypothetical protein